VEAAAVARLPQKYFERHCPAQMRRTSRCGRHSSPRRRGSHEDYRSAPGDLPGTSDMALLGGRSDNRARRLAVQDQGGPGRYLRPIPNQPDRNLQTPTGSLLTQRFLVSKIAKLGSYWFLSLLSAAVADHGAVSCPTMSLVVRATHAAEPLLVRWRIHAERSESVPTTVRASRWGLRSTGADLEEPVEHLPQKQTG
jgi:hypothetical protein